MARSFGPGAPRLGASVLHNEASQHYDLAALRAPPSAPVPALTAAAAAEQDVASAEVPLVVRG